MIRLSSSTKKPRQCSNCLAQRRVRVIHVNNVLLINLCWACCKELLGQLQLAAGQLAAANRRPTGR